MFANCMSKHQVSLYYKLGELLALILNKGAIQYCELNSNGIKHHSSPFDIYQLGGIGIGI